ncbi:hypothetical protein ACXR2T_12110 [Leucobacter sp. HY1910]
MAIMKASPGSAAITLAENIARRARRRGTNTPLEVTALFTLGKVTHDEMLQDLCSRDYTYGKPQGYDAYAPGSWDEVKRARMFKLISSEDYALISTRLREKR